MLIENEKIKNILKTVAVALIAVVYALFFKLIVEARGFFSTGGNGVALIIARTIGLIAKDDSYQSVLYMVVYILIFEKSCFLKQLDVFHD